MLAQQLAAWNSSQSATNPQTLEKQLSDLQTQLIHLQARYTDDYPDVIKTKADIAEVKKKLDEINEASAQAADTSADKASASEPAEIQQLRLQIHQYGDLIARRYARSEKAAAGNQLYQGRVSLSPGVEEQYKELTRDYDNAQKELPGSAGQEEQGRDYAQDGTAAAGRADELLNPANLPDSPELPQPAAVCGRRLGAGLALGVGLAMWLEFRDKSIRTEADAEAALELPMLVSVPWVGEAADGERKRQRQVLEPQEESGASSEGDGRTSRRTPCTKISTD